MKKIFKQLGEIKDDLEVKLENMNDAFDGKSDKWQESDKATEMEDKMENIQMAIDDLNMVITSIELIS